MKFGKRIKTEVVEEWADHYVDYKELKHLLKPLIGKTDEAEEDEFAAAILAEITKVDRFFQLKETELYAEFRLLCQQVNETHLEVSQANFATLDKLFQAHKGTPAGELIKDFLSLSAKVDKMRKFVMMNTLAVIKITKKHDKHQARQLQQDMVDNVHSHHFYCSSRFGTLITDIEVLATQIMFRLTKAQPLAESYSCPICLGILCNPVVLSCGHRFCMKCVSAASYFCNTSCPVCRKEQILDMETIKVDTLLSHFLERYFPEGQSGVKQCKECQTQKSLDPERQRMPCEECNLSLLESLGKMQKASIQFNKKSKMSQNTPDDAKQDLGWGAKAAPEVDLHELEVRPRLKRRSVGAGGKQALGGRPHMGADANAPPIVLNAAMLRMHFNLPLNDAAKRLGVCATAIKKVCRKIGIKQWPHRKLKAVEKRLTLLQAEHRHATGDTLLDQNQAEIADLEKKRTQLLQGGDCDISSIGVAGPAPGASPGRGSKSHLQDDDDDVDDDVGESELPSFAMAVEIMPAIHQPQRVPFNLSTRGEQGALVEAHGHHGDKSGEAGIHGGKHILRAHPHIVNAQLHYPSHGQHEHQQHGEGWMMDSGEDDVWEILHQMMDEPQVQHPHAGAMTRSMANVPASEGHSSMNQGGLGGQSRERRDRDGQAGGDRASMEAVEGAGDKLLKRVGSLEEEVINLRQFTMTLIKERGDLAMRIQDLDIALRDMTHKNDALEEELAKYRPGGRVVRASSIGLNGGPASGLFHMAGGSASPAPEFDFLTHDSPNLTHVSHDQHAIRGKDRPPSPSWLSSST